VEQEENRYNRTHIYYFYHYVVVVICVVVWSPALSLVLPLWVGGQRRRNDFLGQADTTQTKNFIMLILGACT